MLTRTTLIVPALLLGGLAASASACEDFFYVSATGPYYDIQTAISAADDGDCVLVANGTWTGAGNRGLDLGGRELTIRSASGDRNACIIDCGHNDRAFRFDPGDGNCVLQDLTIRNGTASQGGAVLVRFDATPTLRNLKITNCYASDQGGAIRIWEGANVTIEDCSITNNDAGTNGGGLAIGSAQATIVNTTFVANTAVEFGGAAHMYLGIGGMPAVTFDDCLMQANEAASGGAVSANWAGPLSFYDCTIYQNDATNGGALYLQTCNAQFAECAFFGNDAVWGGVGHILSSTADFVRTRFQDNQADHSSALRYDQYSYGRLDNCRFLGNEGGGPLGVFESSTVHMANALFSGNQGTGAASAMYVAPSCEAWLTSSTLSHNHTDSAGGAAVYGAGTVYVHNSIAWGNDAGGLTGSTAQLRGPGTIDVENSCVQNLNMSLYSGSNNTAADPLFTDPLGGNGTAGDEDDDCRLQTGSPAIDTGHNGLLIVDLFDLDTDTLIAEAVPVDLDDTARIKNGTTDMGAYEREPAVPPLPGDLDGDGDVDVDDLIIVMLNWGTDGPGADLAAPYNVVTVDDLVVIFLNWT